MLVTKDLGNMVRELREARGLTRNKLAEQVGISLSHLEKIEIGMRNPGMETFMKMITVLNVDWNIHNSEMTVQEKCVSRVQNILLNSSKAEALFLTRTLEFMANNLNIAQII